MKIIANGLTKESGFPFSLNVTWKSTETAPEKQINTYETPGTPCSIQQKVVVKGSTQGVTADITGTFTIDGKEYIAEQSPERASLYRLHGKSVEHCKNQ